MATVNLGSIKFNWQGAYNGATAYAVDDVVSYNGSSYICKLASTGNLPTNTTYFDQMSSAGTNGTDLTSTLTTQGDLVYRDGSGLQRLGAGTAGQVLQTGGAGANPSWGTVSSDYVYINTYTQGSSTTTWDITGFVDTSTYRAYDIFIHNVTTNVNGNYFVMQMLYNNGASVDTSNVWWHVYTRVNGTTTPTASGGQYVGYNQPYYLLVQNSNSGSQSMSGELYLEKTDSLTSGEYTRLRWKGQCWDGTTTMHMNNGSGAIINNSYDYDGIRIFDSGAGNINSGAKAVVYGYKY